MKRSLLLFSSLFLVGSVMAQFPDAGELASYKAKLDKNNQEITDAKKASNPKTWLKRSELLEEISEAPTKGIWTGMTPVELQLFVGKPESVNTEVIKDITYNVQVYHACALYFSNGKLSFSKVLHPVVQDPLLIALSAVDEAVKVDTKSNYLKKTLERYIELNKKLRSVGTNFYTAGDIENAFRYFSAAADCASRPTVGNMDTLMTYYAGFTAMNLGKNVEAIGYFKKANSTGFYGENKDGGSFINIARCYANLKDKSNAEAALLEGFQKFPSNQGIIIELINHYLNNGEDPSKVFPILHKAQANEPTNASLFFAEGTLYEKLANDIRTKIPGVIEEINNKAKERMQYRKDAEALLSEADQLRYESAKLKRAKNVKESTEKLNLANAKLAESDKLYAKADAVVKNDIPVLNKKIDDINAEAIKMQETAEKVYLKSISINPSFFDAQYNLGALYYNRGVAAIQAASRLDLKDEAGYKKLTDEADANFKQALDPFIKAHALQPTEKYTIETLKNIYFRFRNNSEEMMAKYKEFNTKIQTNK